MRSLGIAITFLLAISLRLPVKAAFGFTCIFIFYYGFILCISALFGLIAPIFVSLGKWTKRPKRIRKIDKDSNLFQVPIILSAVGHPVEGLVIPNQKTFAFISLGFLGLQYFWFLLAFVLHKLCEKVSEILRKMYIKTFRSFLMAEETM